MNTRNNNPLRLSNIQLENKTVDSVDAMKRPSILEFDSRSDFEIEPVTPSNLSVLLTFTNGRLLSTDSRNSSGIRRRVSLNIMDITAGAIIHTHLIRVNIPRDEYMRVRNVDLPFSINNLNTDHSYKILVRDECSKKLLGEKMFHLFDTTVLGSRPYDWYIAKSGGIIPEWGDRICLCVLTDQTYTHTVRFNLDGNFSQDPLKFPELEIRIYGPAGKIESSFVTPQSDHYGATDFYVEKSVFLNHENQGIYYAELLCMDYPVAGFAFSTAHTIEYGAWTGQYLKHIEEYSLDEATNRYWEGMRENSLKEGEETPLQIDATENDETCEMTVDDEFEKALDRFIQTENESLSSAAETDFEEVSDTESSEETDGDNRATDESTPHQLITFDHLTGLHAVKKKLEIYERIVRFNKMRTEHGLPTSSTPLHSMFLGSPGTGKTTVAKMIGVMLRRAGVLSKGHVVVRERATLLGQNYNSESEKTLQAIEEAQGGILFIDEAYQLFQSNDPRDPGKFVIETLLTALADESNRDWMLILAGYPDEMNRMFEINPGFRSRIPESNIYLFEDFSDTELLEIAENYLARNRYSLSSEARSALADKLKSDYTLKKKNFGNARHVINLIQADILPAMAVRVTSADITDTDILTSILPCDIPQPQLPSDNQNRPRIGFTA